MKVFVEIKTKNKQLLCTRQGPPEAAGPGPDVPSGPRGGRQGEAAGGPTGGHTTHRATGGDEGRLPPQQVRQEQVQGTCKEGP